LIDFVLAFNRGAIPWWVKGEPTPEKGIMITFLQNDDMVAFSACHAKQSLLRRNLEQQEQLKGRVVLFAGPVSDVPLKFHAKHVPPPEYFDASACPCGLKQKDGTKHQQSKKHKDWLLEQQKPEDMEDDDDADPVAGGPGWW
jgi:hypothetical protein